MLIDLDLKSNDEKYLKVSEYIYYFLVGVITFYVNGCYILCEWELIFNPFK